MIKTGTMDANWETVLKMVAKMGADHGYSKRGQEMQQQEARNERKRAEEQRRRADELAERVKTLEREQRRRERSPSPRRHNRGPHRSDYTRRERSPSRRGRRSRDQHTPRRGRGGPCRFFTTARGCKKGSACDFEHVRRRHEVIKATDADRQPEPGTNAASSQETPAPAAPDPIANEFEQEFHDHESGGERHASVIQEIMGSYSDSAVDSGDDSEDSDSRR